MHNARMIRPELDRALRAFPDCLWLCKISDRAMAVAFQSVPGASGQLVRAQSESSAAALEPAGKTKSGARISRRQTGELVYTENPNVQVRSAL